MEEPLGAQYAVHVAVYTLKERCRSLQQRVDVLEEENRNLYGCLSRSGDIESSLSEIDKLNQIVAELTEQNKQLENKCKMVIKENDTLWENLSLINKNLDAQMGKMNDTSTQHTTSPSTLIRSKTFTQVEPQTRILQKNLEENDKISSEFEDILLKIADSMSKHKLEIDELGSKITDLKFSDNLIVNSSFGFNYNDETDDDLLEDVETIFQNFKYLSDEAVQQNEMLRKQIQTVEKFLEHKQQIPKKEMQDHGTFTGDDNMQKTKSEEEKASETSSKQSNFNLYSPEEVAEYDKICPMCCRNFYRDSDFQEFHQHVQSHFVHEETSFEVL